MCSCTNSPITALLESKNSPQTPPSEPSREPCAGETRSDVLCETPSSTDLVNVQMCATTRVLEYGLLGAFLGLSENTRHWTSSSASGLRLHATPSRGVFSQHSHDRIRAKSKRHQETLTTPCGAVHVEGVEPSASITPYVCRTRRFAAKVEHPPTGTPKRTWVGVGCVRAHQDVPHPAYACDARISPLVYSLGRRCLGPEESHPVGKGVHRGTQSPVAVLVILKNGRFSTSHSEVPKARPPFRSFLKWAFSWAVYLAAPHTVCRIVPGWK